MGLKDRLLQAKCKVGAHSGEWKQLATGSCDEQRTCVNCGAVSNRIDHHLSGWAYTDDPAAPACTRERHCQRCPVAEQEVKHTMEWRALDRYSAPCLQSHVCSRCGLQEGAPRMHHRWDSGEFTEGARMVVFTCKVCRATELRNRMLCPSSSRGVSHSPWASGHISDSRDGGGVRLACRVMQCRLRPAAAGIAAVLRTGWRCRVVARRRVPCLPACAPLPRFASPVLMPGRPVAGPRWHR